MERIYEIESYDNGWVIRDQTSVAYQVCEEKQSDKKHEKFKRHLGDWLYEDLDTFLNEQETIKARITITFEKFDDDDDGQESI